MAKYVIKKVKTWNGVKYAIQTAFTHFPVVYDGKGNMVTEKRNVPARKKGDEPRMIDVPKIKETVTMVTVEYREKTKGLNGKTIFKTVPALFENTSAGLVEAKRVRDMLIEKDRKEAEEKAKAAEKATAKA